MPQGHGGHGGGPQSAFGGQQPTGFARLVSHGGTDPCVTAWRNDAEKGRLQMASYACAIAAAVLGGCRLTGGRISLIGTLFGAFVLRGIQSFLILLGVQPQWYILVVGLIVVLASLADRTLTRFATKH